MKLWQKNYDLNKQIEHYTIDNDFILDKDLIIYDCIASIAHVHMLYKIKILNKDERDQLILELNNIINLSKKNKFKISESDEDSHTAIENYLVKKLGDVGKKIHTARSRNDQVLTALRLYSIENLKTSKKLCFDLIKQIKHFSNKYKNIQIPGFTHTRKAMPVSIAVWSNGLIQALEDDIHLIDSILDILNTNPLGTGAGFGIPLNIDRKYTAKLLGFKKIQNPIYAQLSRGKFEALIIHSLTAIMFDLNRLASELILFSMPSFGFFILPNEFLTGSSIMPQKKNPDVLEIMRAKYHKILGYEMQVKSSTANLIFGYHRDFQLTKQCLFDSFEITNSSLKIACLIFSRLQVDKKNCKKALTKEIFATHEVYNLVKQGVCFRNAYREIAKQYD